MPESRDSEFTWKNFQETNNNELVNNLANFINRVIVLTNKYYGGEVPKFDENIHFVASCSDSETSFNETELLDLHDKILEVVTAISQYDFRTALNEVMAISSSGNQLLQFNEPWAKQKTEPERVKSVMNAALQIVAALSVISRPFLPFTSDKLQAMLNLPAIKDDGDLATLLEKLSEGNPILEAGHQIGKPVHLFTRIADEVIEQQIEKLMSSAPIDSSINYESVKETTTFDDFMKMDLRTGVILEAEKMKKADKLLVLKVDLGFETRTVVSGIAKFFKPEEIIGKRVTVLANLAPRKLRGVESQGMILMAEDADGNLGFVSPDEGFGGGFVVR